MLLVGVRHRYGDFVPALGRRRVSVGAHLAGSSSGGGGKGIASPRGTRVGGVNGLTCFTALITCSVVVDVCSGGVSRLACTCQGPMSCGLSDLSVEDVYRVVPFMSLRRVVSCRVMCRFREGGSMHRDGSRSRRAPCCAQLQGSRAQRVSGGH